MTLKTGQVSHLHDKGKRVIHKTKKKLKNLILDGVCIECMEPDLNLYLQTLFPSSGLIHRIDEPNTDPIHTPKTFSERPFISV